MKKVDEFYDEAAQRVRERMDRHRTEFAITMRAMPEFLPLPPWRVLDCGGDPGRYAIVIPLMESCGPATLERVGVEGISAGYEKKLNRLDGRMWEYWVDKIYRFGRDSSLRSAADHLLFIGRK